MTFRRPLCRYQCSDSRADMQLHSTTTVSVQAISDGLVLIRFRDSTVNQYREASMPWPQLEDLHEKLVETVGSENVPRFPGGRAVHQLQGYFRLLFDMLPATSQQDIGPYESLASFLDLHPSELPVVF
eukprot:GEMP01083548.1.p1 GENE.GEMP01083548.1~~GEMP01083548.1.p1  ORF type:complete len:135 (+),score=18.43 GEMP01083548.1:22-405(+)